jgi:hypothetical protein
MVVSLRTEVGTLAIVMPAYMSLFENVSPLYSISCANYRSLRRLFPAQTFSYFRPAW